MVIDSTNIKDTRNLFSQTPPDFVEDNYYIDVLQMKIDADWPYRPNRKWVEEEKGPGIEEYDPLEVVIQTIKSDKGEAISDDYYRLVFKDCQKIVRIGTRYRFAYEPNIAVPDYRKNIWLAINQTRLSPTASQTVVRCNGTIGSLYVDENKKVVRHYEPIVQPDKLSGAGAMHQNEVATDINGGKVILAQFNKYTQQYYINQRFFIDTNASDREHQPVYKIVNIVRSNTLTTYDPTDVGLIRIYYEVDQIGAQDDVENRIAYNGIINEQVLPETDEPINPGESSVEPQENYYTFGIVEPDVLPDVLTTLTFKPELKNNNIVIDDATIGCTYELIGAYYASQVPVENYIDFSINGNGTYTISRKKKDSTMKVNVVCEATAPDGSVYKINFVMKLF